MKGPKSAGRENFEFDRLLKATSARGPDLVRTALEVSVQSIHRTYRVFPHPIKRIAWCGGGFSNPFLMKRLKDSLQSIEFVPIEAMGLNPQTVEAAAFSYLGFLTLQGIPIGGSWTQRRISALFAAPGQIVVGKNFERIQRFICKP